MPMGDWRVKRTLPECSNYSVVLIYNDIKVGNED